MKILSQENYISPVSRENIVKVSFRSNYTYKGTDKKNLRICVWIGSKIMNDLGWKGGDHLYMPIHDNELIITKCKGDHFGYNNMSYKISQAGKGKSFLVQRSLNGNSDYSDKIKTVFYEVCCPGNEICLKVFLKNL